MHAVINICVVMTHLGVTAVTSRMDALKFWTPPVDFDSYPPVAIGLPSPIATGRELYLCRKRTPLFLDSL